MANENTTIKQQGGKGDVVTVACKHPNGVILELVEMKERSEPVMGGGVRTFQQAVRTGKRITIRGPALPLNMPPSFQMIGGYALTPNVPRDFWETWVKQNHDSPLLENKMLLVHDKDTPGMAREFKKVKSGAEPIDPDNPPKLHPKMRIERARTDDDEAA